MKTLKIVFLVCCILLIASIRLYCGWVNKGEYKEIQTGMTIKQLIANKSDSFFIVTDGVNWGKYNYNGDSLFQKAFIIDSGYSYVRISNDGKSYVLSAEKRTINSNSSDIINLVVKLLGTDSIIFSKDLLSVSGDMNASIGFGNIFLDYNSSMGKALYCITRYLSDQHSYVSYNTTDGSVGFYDKNNNSLIAISNYGCKTLSFSPEIKYITSYLYNSDYSEGVGGNQQVKTGYENKLVYFYNSIAKKGYTLTKKYDDFELPNNNVIAAYLPDYYKFANTDSSFIAVSGSNNYLYNFTYDTVNLLNKISLNYKPNDIIFSPNDNFFITTTPNATINIFHIETQTYYKSFQLEDSINAANLYLTPDGNGFITFNSKGSIKYFRPELFSDSLKALFISNVKITYPDKNAIFYNLSTGNPDSCYWDFGDGTNSTEKSPIHSYKKAGKFTVKLVVSKGDFKDTIIINDYITILSNLKADFFGNVLKGDVLLDVNFIDASMGDIKTWNWNFGDGDTSNLKNPSHVFKKPGVFPVRLIVYDGFSYDTLLKNDYIYINQPPLNDTLFEKEKIIWSFNNKITNVKGFEDINGGYTVEIVSGINNYIYRYDSNFDTLWTKYLYPARFHANIQQVSNGTVYVIGNQVQDPDNFSVSRMDKDGEIKLSKKFILTTNDKIIEYTASDKEYMITKLNNNLELYYSKINNNDSIMVSNSFIARAYGDISYVYSCKIINENINGFIYYYNLNSKYLQGTEYSTGCLNRLADNMKFSGNDVGLGSSNKLEIINTFANININEYISIESNRYINKLSYINNTDLYHGYIIWSKIIPNTILKSLLILSNTTFTVSGSKNGYCWFAIMDTSGAILQEHTLQSRLGSFDCVSKNKDGSLLFVGTIYKNSFNGITKKESQDGMLAVVSSTNGLLIMKTKPGFVTPVGETPFSNFDVKIYPNPASNNIVLKCQLPEPSSYSLMIYDIFGNKMDEKNGYNDNSSNEITFNLNYYSSGIYFYKFAAGKDVQTGKFTVLK